MSEQKRCELERVIDQYHEGLYRFAFWRTGSADDSRDIVQSVFVRLYDRHRSLAAIENMKSYLYRATANACADYHRRRQSHKTVPLTAAANVASDSNPDALTAEGERQRINTLLATLSAEQAEVLRMRTSDELTFAEIAEILQIPLATVKSRFRYGIDKLRSNILKDKKL
jgi:RNA polymerase sigma-70 factor (ECF subfamily)